MKEYYRRVNLLIRQADETKTLAVYAWLYCLAEKILTDWAVKSKIAREKVKQQMPERVEFT